jgi:Actin-rearrangement-inducing factor (Arif-1)
MQSYYIKVKCVPCRKFIRRDEGTFFNQNVTTILIAVLTLLVIQLWNTYAVLRNFNRKKFGNNKQSDMEMNTYSFVNDNKPEKDEETCEEEANSDKVMFEQISEARKSVTPPSYRSPRSTPKPGSCKCSNNIYSTPAALRCCCTVKNRNSIINSITKNFLGFNADWVFRPQSSINVNVSPPLPPPIPPSPLSKRVTNNI